MGSVGDPKRPWTDSERRYLSEHRADGREAVASALGRSSKAVKRQGERMGFYVGWRPSKAERCPVCGQWRMERGTASYRAGMCPVCWERHKAEVMRQREAEASAHRDYEREKKRAQSRSKGGRP